MADRYQALIKQRAALRTEYEALDADLAPRAGALTAEDESKLSDIAARLTANRAAVEQAERIRETLRAAPAEADAQTPRITGVHDRILDRPWGYQWAQAGAPPAVVKAAAMGERFLAARASALNQGTDPRLMQATVIGNSEGVPADGGFLVGTDVSDEINLTLTGGELLSRVDHLPISDRANSIKVNMVDESSRATGSRFGGVTGYWVTEGEAPTVSKPTFWQYKLELNKAGALGAATDELLQDAALLGRVIPQAFGEEMKFMAENAILNGTGVGQPLGIIGHASTVEVAKETGQAAATVVYENVLKMFTRIPAKLRSKAVWLVNQEVEPQLWGMALTIGVGGVPVFLPPGGASVAPHGTLLGLPIIPVEYAAALGTVGDIVLANLGEYGFIDKGGVQAASSMHFYFDTGQTAFRAFYRLDGKPKWRTTLTPFKGSATRGPNVTLATRA